MKCQQVDCHIIIDQHKSQRERKNIPFRVFPVGGKRLILLTPNQILPVKSCGGPLVGAVQHTSRSVSGIFTFKKSEKNIYIYHFVPFKMYPWLAITGQEYWRQRPRQWGELSPDLNLLTVKMINNVLSLPPLMENGFPSWTWMAFLRWPFYL